MKKKEMEKRVYEIETKDNSFTVIVLKLKRKGLDNLFRYRIENPRDDQTQRQIITRNSGKMSNVLLNSKLSL